LKLRVSEDVLTRQGLRKNNPEFGFEDSFIFTPTVSKFSVVRQSHAGSRSVTFAFRRTRIVVLDSDDKEFMSATVTLADDRQCKIVVGQEVLEEWQFRKKALESIFFGEAEEAL
jgi:hypothetical protein